MPSSSTRPDEPRARRYLNAFWAGSKLVLLWRDEEGTLHKEERRAEHVCYLRQADVPPDVVTKLRASRYVTQIREDGEWWRVSWASRDFCREACKADGYFDKQKIPVYEADLSPVQRWLVEQEPAIARPRRAYLDLETDSRVPASKKGDGRILCWTLTDHDTGEAIQGVLEADADEAEVLLIEDLYDELLNYDQVAAWFGGDFEVDGEGFDFPVLAKRIVKFGVRVEPRRWLYLDHLSVYKRLNMNVSESGDEKQSFSLEAQAQAVLGRGKVPFDVSKTWEAWANATPCAVARSGFAGGELGCMACRACLGHYNLHDSLLERDLELETGYLELHQVVCELCGVLPNTSGADPLRFVEGYAMRLGRKRGMRFATRFERSTGERFKGAWVMEPTKTGLIKDVHVFDFASLYPSIIIGWNIGLETLAEDVVLTRGPGPSYLSHLKQTPLPLPEGHTHASSSLGDLAFRREPISLLAEMAEQVKTERAKWKAEKNKHPPGTAEWKHADRRVGGFKIVNNSIFGVGSSPFSRLSSPRIGGAICGTGEWLIKLTITAAEQRQWAPFYGDTDSGFVTGCSRSEFASFVSWANAELYPPKLAERGVTRNHVKLAAEKGFDRLIMVTKKTYAGRYSYYEGQDATEDSKPEIKGLEYKRGDAMRLARVFQAQVLDLMLGGGVLYPGGKRRSRVDYCEENPEVLRELALLWRWRVLEGPLEPDDFIISKELGKPLNGYARKLKKDGTFQAPPEHVRVAHVLAKRGLDIGEGSKIDYIVVDGGVTPLGVIPACDYDGTVDRIYLWERIFPCVERILEACWPRKGWRDIGKARPTKTELRRAAQAVEAKKRVSAQPELFGPLFGARAASTGHAK